MTVVPLKEDDRAEGCGFVVRLDDGMGLRYDDGESDPPPADEVCAPGGPTVRIEVPGGTSLLGARVAVAGRWTGSSLIVDEVRARPRPILETVEVEGPPAKPEGRATGGRSDSGTIARAEVPLWEEGVLVSRIFDEDGYAHVVTHDLDRAEAALRPVYGDALVLVESPWSREDYHQIERLLEAAESESVLINWGAGPTEGLTQNDWVTIAYWTEAVASAALTLPAGFLRVETLLRRIPTSKRR